MASGGSEAIVARRPFSRLKIRHLMIGVAFAAVGVFLIRGAWGLADEVMYGPYGFGLSSGLLSPGQSVILVGDHREGTSEVSSGTPCVVEVEPAWDTDSCYDSRPITVKLMAGRRRGASVGVPRRLLRKR